MALPSDGSHTIQFSAVQWHRWHAGTVWPGVNDSSCRLKQPKPAAYLPVSAPGRRRERALVGGNNLGKAERGAAGNQGLSGQFLGEAAAASSSLESNGVDPASAGTRYTRHQNQGAMPVFKLKLELKECNNANLRK